MNIKKQNMQKVNYFEQSYQILYLVTACFLSK
jgi:hypothetical protein